MSIPRRDFLANAPPQLPAHLIVALLALSLTVAIGCQNRKVSVEITAHSDGATRTFATNDTHSDALASVTQAYGNAGVPDAELGRRFTGTFSEDALPSEIGNRGAIGTVQSSLGTSSLYYEQFAARRDEWSAFKERVEAGLLWVRIVGRFIETRKMQDEPTRAAFHAWWNDEIVPCASDFYLMYSGMQAVIQAQRIGAKPRRGTDFSPLTSDEVFRRTVLQPLLLALAERGLITANELAWIQAAGMDGFASARERASLIEKVLMPALLRVVHRFDPSVKELTAVGLAPLGLEFLLWLKMSRDFKDLVLASDAIPLVTKQAIRNGVWDFKLPPPFGFEIDRKPKVTEALVKLNLQAAPILSNGEYDADAKQIVFRGDFYEASARYAPYNAPYYAMWSLPSQRQESVFHGVILEGDALASYCAWELALAEDQRVIWEAALAQIASTGEATDAYAFLSSTATSHPMPRALAEWIVKRCGATLPTEYGPQALPTQDAEKTHPPSAAGA